MTVYARAAHIYRDHGWSTFPLPAGAKEPPPVGYTGATGVDPTDEQIQAWCDTMPDGNIAIRLPDGVIGIDIDAYGDKHGDASLLALEAELGLLPATWCSTSRGLGKSGIRLFRVPPGRYEDKPAPSIEIIQHHHRYMLVMPSIHPEGRPYLWFDADGVEQHRPPLLDELPWLPQPWVDQLRERVRTGTTYEPRAHQVDEWAAAVTRAFTKALLDMPGGRHDATLHGVLALIRLELLEYPGAEQALEQLGNRFRAAIADRSTPREADKEWRDMIDGGYEIAAATPSQAPKWEAWAPPASQADVDDFLRSREKQEAPPETDEGLSGRVAFDDTFWTRDRTGQQWLLQPVLALGRSHALYAPAKGYKSLITLEWAVSVATGCPLLDSPERDPQAVLYVDFEQTEDDLWERLTSMGYGAGTDLSRFHYHLHPTIPTLDSWQGGMALLAHIDKVKPAFVIIDTVSRTIAGEENSSDTIINLARQTFTPIKARGITSLRLDHAGKDIAKGQRGTSAKNDDVDIVWQLTKTDTGAALLATHRRIGWVPEKVVLNLSTEPTRFTLGDEGWPPGTAELAHRLDACDIPLDISTRKARILLNQKQPGQPVGAETVLTKALKWRREQAVEGFTGARSTLRSTLYPQGQKHPSEAEDQIAPEQGEAVSEAPRSTPPRHQRSSVLPNKGSTTATSPESEAVQPDLSAWETEEF